MKTKKPKIQFSKQICVISLVFVGFMLLANVALAWFGRQLLDNITVATIGTFGGFTTTGYFALSAVRDCSKNKHNITENKTTGGV
jgi:uncharacterized membrane protein (DUF485 family)